MAIFDVAFVVVGSWDFGYPSLPFGPHTPKTSVSANVSIIAPATRLVARFEGETEYVRSAVSGAAGCCEDLQTVLVLWVGRVLMRLHTGRDGQSQQGEDAY